MLGLVGIDANEDTIGMVLTGQDRSQFMGNDIDKRRDVPVDQR